jgi:hypothetical protein
MPDIRWINWHLFDYIGRHIGHSLVMPTFCRFWNKRQTGLGHKGIETDQ